MENLDKTAPKFEFPKTLTANGIWTQKGEYVLTESKINGTDVYVFYRKEIPFGFGHAIEIMSVWLEKNPKRLIKVKNLSLFCKMKSDTPDKWLICNEFYYLTIQDALGALQGKTRVYPPKRKPEVIRELTTEQVYEYWDCLKIYDNNGKTMDRYTVIINTDIVTGVFSMSKNPHSPQGMNQFGCEISQLKAGEDELGKRVEFAKLPEEVQEAIRERLKPEENES